MKAKLLAKRLRARSVEFHRMARSFEAGDATVAERARLLADVLQEVADQLAPLSKKMQSKGKPAQVIQRRVPQAPQLVGDK